MSRIVQPPLPGMPEPPPRPEPTRRGTLANPNRITWRRDRTVRPPLCAACQREAYEAGTWLPVQVAVYRRTQNGKTVAYCTQHATAQRQADRLGDASAAAPNERNAR